RVNRTRNHGKIDSLSQVRVHPSIHPPPPALLLLRDVSKYGDVVELTLPPYIAEKVNEERQEELRKQIEVFLLSDDEEEQGKIEKEVHIQR
ncbi:8849_t:CDS:2, partial [Paraglomus occultum]